MAIYTPEIVKEGENWVALIYVNGAASIKQEFDHRKFGMEPFATEAEATEWANAYIAAANEDLKKGEIAVAQTESDLALDRAYKEAFILQTLVATESI